MERSTFNIAPVYLGEAMYYMGMINNGIFYLFDSKGKTINRNELALPDVFVLLFKDGEDRSYRLAKDGEDYGFEKFYVINNNNEVIFTSENGEFNTYCRITPNTIVLGIKEIDKSSQYMIAANKRGRLIANNTATNYAIVGQMDDYYLFEDDENHYHLYTLQEDWEDVEAPEGYTQNEKRKFVLKSQYFTYVNSVNAKFLMLWKTTGKYCADYRVNLIYIEPISQHIICIESYDGYYIDSQSYKKTFKIDASLDNIKWERDIQILSDDNSIILHHCNISSNYKGFTIIIVYDDQEGIFKLTNQKRLGKYYNDSIKLYSNSLILEGDSYGDVIYDRNGNVITKTNSGYDYQKGRAGITDYAIFQKNLSAPYIKSPIKNELRRYGVLGLDKLQIVVPPNFSEIDFVVLEQPSLKHYRVKGEYEIYIKACIECVDVSNRSIEYWGLFKNERYILPCYYKNINVQQIKNDFLLIFEDHNGNNGVLYKDEIIAHCIYKSVEIHGYYLFMKREDGHIDLLYVHGNYVVLKNYSSITITSIDLKFLKKTFISEDTLIVEKDGKYGVIRHGEKILDCVYDSIKTINAKPNVNISCESSTTFPVWLEIQSGKKKGVLGTEHGEIFLSKIIYDNVEVVDCKTYNSEFNYGYSRLFILLLDGKAYYPKDKGILICSNENLSFRGFLSPSILAFSNDDGDILELYDNRGNTIDYVVINQDGVIVNKDKNIDSLDGMYAIPINPNLAYHCYDEYKDNVSAFYFGENKIYSNPLFPSEEDMEDDENEYNSYECHDDDYDYERDTYYALGGDDYDEWRANGGNLDDMMDGMGF